MEELPEDLEYIDQVMSNYDHEIEEWAEERLKKENVFGTYSGWNFYGSVWHDDIFKCQVKINGIHMATIEADMLKFLMKKVSNEFGWD